MARSVWTMVCGGVLASLALALAVACGGTESSSVGPAADAAIEGGDLGEGGAGEAGSGYTLDNVCEKIAPKVCAPWNGYYSAIRRMS